MFDIEKIIRRLLFKYDGFATIIANMKFIESYDITSHGNPTAATDGKNFLYHPDFMNSLDEDEQLFIVAHEVSHVAYDHINRSEGKDPKIWNKAADGVINANLKKDGLKPVEGGVDIPDALDYDVETLYEKLLEENKNKQNSNSSDDNQNHSNSDKSNGDNHNGEDNDVGHDTHKLWEEAIKKAKESTTNQEENGQEDISHNKNSSDTTQNDRKHNNNNSIDNNVKKEQENNAKLDEKEDFKRNREQRLEKLKKLRDELVSKSMGNNSSSSKFNMDSIGDPTSLINWERLLRNSINSKIDWSYKNSTIEDGVLTPHLEELSNPETEILLDTSGSIDDQLLRNFLKECKGILNTSKIKVGCFDTEFYGFTEIRRESDIDNMIFQGRGGTDFNAAVNAFTRKVDNKIIFTDGCADMPETPMNIIWIVFGDIKINPKGGKVIYIGEDDLNKLRGTIRFRI